MTDTGVLSWLLEADPALRWQAERDLAGAPRDVWEATRARVATEGFGAQLLARQDDDGQWAGGAYFPADATRDEPGQPWTATTWSLNALREWGVDASVLGDTAERLARNSRWEYEDLPYWGGEVDCCINAYTVENGVWLGIDMGRLVDWFVTHQLADGGWNCMWVEGATRSSFHSTLNSLRGLLAHERATGGTDASRAARRRGEEYLLERSLMQRRSTGEPVGDWVRAFVFPFRWRYSVLNALSYFRDASLWDGTPPDPRADAAIDVIRAARSEDGRWMTDGHLEGRTWFEIDADAGEPSRWVTLHARRILEWADGGSPATPRQ